MFFFLQKKIELQKTMNSKSLQMSESILKESNERHIKELFSLLLATTPPPPPSTSFSTQLNNQLIKGENNNNNLLID